MAIAVLIKGDALAWCIWKRILKDVVSFCIMMHVYIREGFFSECCSTQKLSWEVRIMTDFYKLLNDLQLPPIHKSQGKEYYVDPFRERLILKTPEETVRQQVLQYLLFCKNIPKEMIQVEMCLSKYQINSARRADIIVERFNGNKGELSPLAIIECKAPEIMIGDSAIQQAIDYADALNADYIFVTNGDYTMTAKYEAEINQYVLLNELPDYQSMLCGQGDYLPEDQPKERFAFDVLNENKDYYCGYEFNPDTPSELLPFLTNLWECFLDTSHKMPEKQYKHFRLIKDYGIRFLSCGNAAGGSYQGAYRSFLVEYQSNTKFMNLGFFDYGSHTILTVSVDKDNNKPHNSLQYDVNAIIQNGETYSFPHHGKIAIGKKGSGKVSELKELIGSQTPELLVCGDIFLGTLHNQKLLYLDDTDVTNFVEKLLTYALIRDVFREIKLGN